MLVDDVAVVLFAGAAEGFEKDYEEDHANARSGEHALGGVVP